MLDDEQTKTWARDIADFCNVMETQIMNGIISPDDMIKYQWLIKWEVEDLYGPNGLAVPGWPSLACKSVVHRDLRFDRKDFCRFYDIDYIPEKKLKRFYFLTLTGKDRIPDTPENIEAMKSFGLTLFNNERYKRFHKVKWNIETGKKRDNPNLHIHACIWFENSNKNFHSLKPKGRSDVRNTWMKYFNKYGLDYGKDSYQSFSGSMVKTIYEDKMNYLSNVDKSILHKNYRDLEILYEI